MLIAASSLHSHAAVLDVEAAYRGDVIEARLLMGGGQAILIDPATRAPLGASDARKDGLALGY